MIIGVASLIILALWKIPQIQVNSIKDKLTQIPSPDSPLDNLALEKELFAIENEARRTIALIVAGAISLLGLYFTGKTIRLNYEGQITDRFTKAIAQLGNEKLEVRLGGIYALERIARDSDKDYWQVMEILTAYVRENAPWSDDSSSESATRRPTTDIQAVLTVIGRRPRSLSALDNDPRLDLSRTDLRGAFWHKANLNGVRFNKAHLDNAAFHTVFMQGASFIDAHLDGARLIRTNVWRANLDGCSLKGVRCVETNLKEEAFGIEPEQLKDVVNDDPTAFSQLEKEKWNEWAQRNG